MHVFSTAVGVAALVAGAHANIDFDINNSPPECQAMCQPVGQLRDVCAVDLPGDNGWGESQLGAQCFCTNQSFEVEQVSAHCYDCIRQAIENARSNTARAKYKRQAIDGSDCSTNEQCRSGVCAEEPGRPNKVCQDPNGGGEDDSFDPINPPLEEDDGDDGGDDGGDDNEGGQAIDGSDCSTNEQCQSGFCGDQEGRPNKVCQAPGEVPAPEEPAEDEPAGPAPVPEVPAPTPIPIPDDGGDDGQGGGQAIDGSDCQTDDQCQSGLCADQEGRPNKVCQTPGDDGGDDSFDPINPPLPDDGGDDGDEGEEEEEGGQAIDGSDCSTNEQCQSGFCGDQEGRPNKVCQAPPAGDDGGEEEGDEEEGDEPNVGAWEDALNRMSNIVASCTFQTTSYYPEATSMVQGLSVTADLPTASSQLTTTYTSFTSAPTPTPTGGSGEGEGDNGSGGENGGETNNGETPEGEEGSEEGSEEEGESGASTLSPFYLASALIAGFMALI